MNNTNPFFKIIKESAGIRLMILFGSFFIFLILSSIIGSTLERINLGTLRERTLISSATQCVFAFCIPSFLLAKFCSTNPWTRLKIKKIPSLRSLAGVIIVFIVSLPAMEWLIEWNSNLHLPQFMSPIENLLRSWEDAAENTTKHLLDAHGWFSVFTGVMVIGVLTGFSEELFFRGGLQGIFTRTHMNRNMAVWLAAFVFSAMHFQFFGFVPRLIMGAFFGFLIVWTDNLWVPIFAHILNNSSVVITSSIFGYTSSLEMMNETTGFSLSSSMSALISALLTLLLLIVYRDIFFRGKQYRERIWQKRQLPPVSEK